MSKKGGAAIYYRWQRRYDESGPIISQALHPDSALNDGHIRLEGANSEVHNSLIWMDDLHNDTLIQLQMGASDQWDKTTNKNRVGIDGRMTHNAVWGCFQSHAGDNDPGDAYQNHPLSSDNHDIFKGPGFLSPHVAATTSEQRRERNFRLNPSIRTMNMADQDIYRDRVFFRVYPDTCAKTIRIKRIEKPMSSSKVPVV